MTFHYLPPACRSPRVEQVLTPPHTAAEMALPIAQHSNVYVKGLPPECGEAMLLQLFQPHGEVRAEATACTYKRPWQMQACLHVASRVPPPCHPQLRARLLLLRPLLGLLLLLLLCARLLLLLLLPPTRSRGMRRSSEPCFRNTLPAV